MFVTATLARRIERAEMAMVTAGAQAAGRRLPPGQVTIRQVKGGAAIYVEPDAPFNKVVAVGFDGVPAPEELDALERDFAARRAPLQFEISTLADPRVARALTVRRYELAGFENVLGLGLARAAFPEPVAGVEVIRSEDADANAWLDVVATGFMHPAAADGPSIQPAIPRDVLDRVFGDTIAATGFERYIARRAGETAGGASFRITDGVAQLSGAATLPAHRRRGVQNALLRHRLMEAAARGCDIAVVTTEPGSKSQANAQKAGFALLYARAVLVKAPA